MNHRATHGFLAVLVACAAAGCQTEPSGSQRPETHTAAKEARHTADIDPARVKDLWRFTDYRFIWLSSPRELFKFDKIQFAVAGRVAGFAEGPIYDAQFEGDEAAERNVVMAIDVDKTWRGPRPKDGRVYVVMPAGPQSPDYFSQELPNGTRVAAYLQPAPVADDHVRIDNPDAGRPPGSPLWLASPQGLFVDEGDELGVVFPLAKERKPKAKFEDLTPSEPPEGTPTP